MERSAGGPRTDPAHAAFGGIGHRKTCRQNRNFYDAGTATLTDLLDAETLYTQSRNNLTSAYAAYHTSLAKYMRVTGR